MTDTKKIESLLKINGIDINHSDEEIRTVLMGARYNDSEINMALMVLRSAGNINSVKSEGLHKVFRSSEALKPSEISTLLGIEVKMEDNIKIRERAGDVAWVQTGIVIAVAIILALSFVLISMYVYEVGLFHQSVSAFN